MISHNTTLALIPPSCMVAPIRDSGNKFFNKSTTSTTTTRMSFACFENININNVHDGGLDNYDDVRGLTIYPSKSPPSLDEISITEGLVDYTRKIERQNNNLNKDCYDLKLKVLSNKTTLVLSNTRELNRVPNTK